MTKVLFVGHYRECSGWGHACLDTIMSLDAAGVQVVPRCVKLGIRPPELPNRLLELENQSAHDCDTVIQFVLPHLMDYHGGFKKNIGMYCTETSSFGHSQWVDKLNQMDELWVPCMQMKDAAEESGVKTPIKVVHYGTDVEKFEKENDPLDIPPLVGNFVFYFIGDLTIRKNVIALVKAFHLEFGTSEPVSLVIKGSKHGVSPQENMEKISEACNHIKTGLKLYPKVEDYKQEIVISDYLSEADMAGLHCACDCFVIPSFGESWCVPAMDALGYGNTVIAPDVGGPAEFVSWDNGYLCKYREDPCIGMLDTFPDLFTGNENWYSIDCNDLRRQMRQAYTDGVDNPKRQLALRTPSLFSYEKVGQQMKELLC